MNAGLAGMSDEAIERADRLLVGRGWELADAGDDGLAAVYPASLRGADPSPLRLSFVDVAFPGSPASSRRKWLLRSIRAG